ncbi:bacillithiol system redox-active protein YtxJ [Pseudopedobacter beijingensis]|uniref:Bacillithiol system redox-active protein YtxJ n=1 Tax=Pseudopedobacter beijingensis TaxID=1207056 RepID=A0ABW4I995_9SPHI
MNWIALEDGSQIEKMIENPQDSIIFKHSTRCSISLMAKKRIEMDSDLIPPGVDCYFLDLLKYRNLSDLIAERFHVHHESPQLLAIKAGECILDQSHGDISIDEVVIELEK